MMHTALVWRSLRVTALLVGLMGSCLSLGSAAYAQEALASEAVAVDPGEGMSLEVTETVVDESGVAGLGYAFDNAFLFLAAVLGVLHASRLCDGGGRFQLSEERRQHLV